MFLFCNPTDSTFETFKTLKECKSHVEKEIGTIYRSSPGNDKYDEYEIDGMRVFEYTKEFRINSYRIRDLELI